MSVTRQDTSPSRARAALKDAFGYLVRGTLPGGSHDTDTIVGEGPLTPSYARGAALAAIAQAAELLGDNSLTDAIDREHGWGKYRRPEGAEAPR